ncbi:Peptidase M20 dimerisation domain-containing protein [Sphingomonas antarctica]|uniref:M20/M25/M40 family metallo-hydrolase n=1 Tax=Sphingomonas antarctica TaxID=2040274 RepID=UPI0039ED9837
MKHILLATALIAAPAMAKLSAPEVTMTKTVDADYDRTVALLEKLVNQNSGTLNLAGVDAVGKMMRAEFEPLGFTVRWVPQGQAKRAGHLIATHIGKAGTKKLLLIGHLDTVFEPDSGFLKFERSGDMAHGPGAGDDKGGLVVIVSALRAMNAAGTLKAANIEVVMTGDEEDSGDPLSVSRKDLIEAGKRADIALDFEGLVVIDGQDWGSIARRSAGSWTVSATGTSAHSSGVFSKEAGYGAIYELARILDDFRRELSETNLTYNVGLIAGGQTATLDAGQVRAEATGKTNIIPPIAVARGDLRALSNDQIARTQAKMRAIVARHLPGTGATLSFDEGYPAMAPTPGNAALLTKLNVVNTDLGLKAMPALDPLKRGAGDISFVAGDVDGLAGLGTDSSGDHTPRETVDLASIRRQAKRAAIMMSRLSAERAIAR